MQPNTTLDRARARIVKVRSAVSVLCVALLALIAAGTAQAHVGSISIDCSAVTFNFTKFPSGVSQIDYSIRVDGHTSAAGTFGVTGPVDSYAVTSPVQGNHEVAADASWSADGGGSLHASANLTCAAPAPPPAPAPAPLPAPPLFPAPPPAPADVPTPAVSVPTTDMPSIPTSDEVPAPPGGDTPSTSRVPAAPQKPPVTNCAIARKLNRHVCALVRRPVPSTRIRISTTRWVGVETSRQTINLPFTR